MDNKNNDTCVICCKFPNLLLKIAQKSLFLLSIPVSPSLLNASVWRGVPRATVLKGSLDQAEKIDKQFK